jgi:hypothetical protein
MSFSSPFSSRFSLLFLSLLVASMMAGNDDRHREIASANFFLSFLFLLLSALPQLLHLEVIPRVIEGENSSTSRNFTIVATYGGQRMPAIADSGEKRESRREKREERSERA